MYCTINCLTQLIKIREALSKFDRMLILSILSSGGGGGGGMTVYYDN